jgi:hypothetical protein
MVTMDEKVLQQRLEAAQRVRRKYPDQCAANQDHYCKICDFQLSLNGEYCSHRLAPCTSQGLPCPYFRALFQNLAH